MVVIRLSRGGSKKRPFYGVVVANSRAARDGKYLERLGYFNPIAKGGEKRLDINLERVNYWVGIGAQTSERVAKLLQEINNPAMLEKKQVKTAVRKAKLAEKAKVVAASEQPVA
jgi:small subunit ribosomal protein S16